MAGNRVALVTGSATGIGRSVAWRLADRGYAITVNYSKSKAEAEETADGVRSRGAEVLLVQADVGDDAAVRSLVAETVGRFGGLDVLVNNAGIAGPTGPIDEIEPGEWERTIAVNLSGQYYLARRAVPLLKRSRANPVLIAMGSAAGRLGCALRAPYASSKWGVVGLVRSLAIELGPCGVRVNAILPGPVAGEHMRGVIASRAAKLGVGFDAMQQQYLSRISLRRMVTCDDVAAMALFLCSPAARNVSGQAISVDGNVECL